MKKLTVAFAALLLVAFTAYEAHSQMARVGVKGGVNFSNLYQSDVDDNNVRTGFHVGLFTKAPVTEFFAIQPELMFSTQGAGIEDDGLVEDISVNLSYINLPVLAVINFTENLNVHVGPYIGYLVNDPNASFDTDLVDGEFEFERNNFNLLDYGVSGGIGVNLAALSLGVRYNLGLNAVGDEGFAGAFFGDSKNQNLQLYIALGAQ